MKIRRRIRVKNERSKFRFSKMKVYYSDVTGLSYHYEGKNNGGVFMFITTGKGLSGSFNGYESDVEKLNLKEKK